MHIIHERSHLAKTYRNMNILHSFPAHPQKGRRLRSFANVTRDPSLNTLNICDRCNRAPHQIYIIGHSELINNY